MQPNAYSYSIYNYSDMFSEYFFRGKAQCTSICPEHTLIFVFSGELVVCGGSYETTVRKGECVFLRKDANTILIRKTYDDKPFSSVFMGLSYNFLYQFYQTLKKKNSPEDTGNFLINIVKLPQNPYLKSIYVSLCPYLHRNINPMEQIVEIKLIEAVLSLLTTDKRFYTCLFDFTESYDMNNNYMQNLSIDYFPLFTGSSLSAPHINCKLANEPSLARWVLTKKTETTYIKLQHENNDINIYMEVKYQHIACLIRTFGKPCGFTLLN